MKIDFETIEALATQEAIDALGESRCVHLRDVLLKINAHYATAAEAKLQAERDTAPLKSQMKIQQSRADIAESELSSAELLATAATQRYEHTLAQVRSLKGVIGERDTKSESERVRELSAALSTSQDQLKRATGEVERLKLELAGKAQSKG